MLKRTLAFDLTSATSLNASSARAQSPEASSAAPSRKRSLARASAAASCARAPGVNVAIAAATSSRWRFEDEIRLMRPVYTKRRPRGPWLSPGVPSDLTRSQQQTITDLDVAAHGVAVAGGLVVELAILEEELGVHLPRADPVP